MCALSGLEKFPHRKLSVSLPSTGGAADQGVLSLHDEGWPHLRGRGHLWQRGLPCPCHSPGHQVTTRVQRNRDHLSFSLDSHESRMQDGGGWGVVSRSCFQPQCITNVFLGEEVGQRLPRLVSAASSALNQTPSSFCLQLF